MSPFPYHDHLENNQFRICFESMHSQEPNSSRCQRSWTKGGLLGKSSTGYIQSLIWARTTEGEHSLFWLFSNMKQWAWLFQTKECPRTHPLWGPAPGLFCSLFSYLGIQKAYGYSYVSGWLCVPSKYLTPISKRFVNKRRKEEKEKQYTRREEYKGRWLTSHTAACKPGGSRYKTSNYCCLVVFAVCHVDGVSEGNGF